MSASGVTPYTEVEIKNLALFLNELHHSHNAFESYGKDKYTMIGAMAARYGLSLREDEIILAYELKTTLDNMIARHNQNPKKMPLDPKVAHVLNLVLVFTAAYASPHVIYSTIINEMIQMTLIRLFGHDSKITKSYFLYKKVLGFLNLVHVGQQITSASQDILNRILNAFLSDETQTCVPYFGSMSTAPVFGSLLPYDPATHIMPAYHRLSHTVGYSSTALIAPLFRLYASTGPLREYVAEKISSLSETSEDVLNTLGPI